MAYHGHWLYDLLVDIPTISKSSALTYWYQIKKGVIEEGVFDPEMIRNGILESSTPPAAALRFKTFLDYYPAYATDELKAIATAKYEPKERKTVKKMLKLEEIEALLADADSKLAPEGMAKARRGAERPMFQFRKWVVLELAMRQQPLRVAEMASIKVNDPEAPNNYDLETDTLTLAVHKNAKVTGTREHSLHGFGYEWAQRALMVFGKIPEYLIGTKVSAHTLTTFLTKAGISSQALRPAITTAHFKAMSFKERVALADRMGHSLGVQASVYRRD